MVYYSKTLFRRTGLFLKLDVEGCGSDILETSRNVIAKIPRLAIEVHTDLLPEDGIHRILDILQEEPCVLWKSIEIS